MARPVRDNLARITPAEPTPEYILVTPQMAHAWLAQNNANRNLRNYKVADYARDMRAGRWSYSNDGICISTDGRLLNGQHRLSAVIEAGVPVHLLVIQNMPVDSMINMDVGIVRTAADVLGLREEKNTHLLAAIARRCAIIDDGRIYSDTRQQQITRSELVTFIDENPLLRHIAQYVGSVRSHIDARPSAIGAAYWMIQQVNGTSLAEYYFDQLASRENEPSGSAVLAVDSRLRQVRRDRNHYPDRNHIYLLVKGWNHYAVDKRVSSIAMSPRGEFRLPAVVKWQRGSQ